MSELGWPLVTSDGVPHQVSELGVFSTLLTAKPGKVLLNEEAGPLVRTKLDGVQDEGGVGAGRTVLSSLLSSPSLGRKKPWWSS